MLFKQHASLALALTPLVFALAAPASHAATNLVTNPGFETGDFTGYTQGGNTGGTIVSLAYGTYNSNSGNYFALLGPIGSDGTLSQSLNTIAGDDYLVSFYLASNGTTPNDFSATFNNDTFFSESDIPATSASAPYQYVEETATIAATSSSTDLTFAFRDDPSYIALDDISVTEVPNASPAPEPSQIGMLALMGLGLGGLMLRARKAKATA
jgi:hypothetical protein